MSSPVDPSPRVFVLDLDELTSVHARFVHRDPITGTHGVLDLDVARNEWEQIGRPASLRVTLACS